MSTRKFYVREAETVYTGRRREGVKVLRSPDDVARMFADLANLPREEFHVVLLDGRHRPILSERISVGTLTASLVHPRETFRLAVRESAAAILIVHNHPSGDPKPSPEDIEVTRRLAAAGDMLGVQVLDHVVVAEKGHVSLRELGILPYQHTEAK